MQFEIAKYTDIPELVDLLSVLFMQEVEFLPDTNSQKSGLSKIIENPDIGHILVARDSGKVIGMVNLLYTVSTALGSRVCLLEDMVVSPDFRGKSVGSDLIGFALAFAKSQGCMRITLLTDNSNAAAQRFYKRFGFEASSMIPLRLSLSGNI